MARVTIKTRGRRTNGWRVNGFCVALIEFKTSDARQPIACHVKARTARTSCRRHPRKPVPFAWYCNATMAHQGAPGRRKFATRVVRAGDALTVITPTTRANLTLFDPYHFEQERPAPPAPLPANDAGPRSKLMAGVGDHVKKGQPVIILEAIDGTHPSSAPRRRGQRGAVQENELVPDGCWFAFAE